MRRVLIAPDGFKGSLSAIDAAALIATGLKEMPAFENAEIRLLPLSDGGEGVLSVLARSIGPESCTLNDTPCQDALGRPLTAPWLSIGTTAFVSAAQAAGIARLTRAERDSMRACSAGFGAQAVAAINAGMTKCVFALGGSAVVDGGTGFARAMGWRFLDKQGDPLPPGGGDLHRLETIVPPLKRPEGVFEVWADVNNPLCGETGAARVYAPQKGANPDQVAVLERGLAQLKAVALRTLPFERVEEAAGPGGGSAGGLGFALRLFMGAKRVNGAEAVLNWVGFEDHVRWADMVITGEGRFDAQTQYGKLVATIAARCKASQTPVWVAAGDAGAGWETIQKRLGIAGCSFLTEKHSPDAAMAQAKTHLSHWAVNSKGFQRFVCHE